MDAKPVLIHVALLTFLLLIVVAVTTSLLQNRESRKETTYQQASPKMVIRENDHFFGNRNASVKIVEYAEPECTYCKRLHPVLLRVVRGNEGKVALVYRHFPLPRHPKSFVEATALECAAEIGGDSSFWAYLEALYKATPSDNKIDLAILPQLARNIGIAEDTFNQCIASDHHKAHVRDDIESGFALDVNSVPQLFVLAPNGKVFVFRSSPSYATLSATVEAALGLAN